MRRLERRAIICASDICISLAEKIKNEINDVIRRFEPRVNVVELTVEPNYDENAFDVNFEFEIRGREDVAPLEINFLLQRTQ